MPVLRGPGDGYAGTSRNERAPEDAGLELGAAGSDCGDAVGPARIFAELAGVGDAVVAQGSVPPVVRT